MNYFENTIYWVLAMNKYWITKQIHLRSCTKYKYLIINNCISICSVLTTDPQRVDNLGMTILGF